MNLKEEAKRYIKEMYTSHKCEDMEAWDRLIDTIFDYIDQAIAECRSTR